jgi:signal peptidase I
MTFKGILKKIWDFLWHSNSIWSLIIDIILIFLIMKFLLLPGLGLILGTPLPLVIVESGSMEHAKTSYDKNIMPNLCGHSYPTKGSVNFNEYWQECGAWYETRNITEEMFSKFSFKNGFDKGDIMMIKGQKSYKVGDVIVFKVKGYSTPIIHRIVSIKQDDTIIYSTKGDHNDGQIPYEKDISEDQILGKAIARIPKIGWIKLFFAEL